MSKYEVTQQLFSYVLNNYNPNYNVTQAQGAPAEGMTINPMYPVSGVTYNEAVTFCNYLSIICGFEPCYTLHKNTTISMTDPITWWFISTSNSAWQITCDITKNGYRLPTEAEWEYAAGGGGNLIVRNSYSGTNTYDELTDYAWCASIADGTPHKVGTKKPNNLGIYDLSGNVMEWCTDLYSYGSTVNYYTSTSKTNPCVNPEVFDTPDATKRVCRGGSYRWNDDSLCRVSWRDGNAPGYRSGDVGFRLVRTIE